MVKGVGVHPPPSPARVDFSIMMGYTPETAIATLCVRVLSDFHYPYKYSVHMGPPPVSSLSEYTVYSQANQTYYILSHLSGLRSGIKKWYKILILKYFATLSF